MYFTYIIKSEASGKIYIGQTSDLLKRVDRHNYGGSLYTKNKGPWEILFFFEFETRAEAIRNKLKFYFYLVSNSPIQKIDSLIY